MQVLSILTMERPVSFEAEDIRDEKASSLRVHSFPIPRIPTRFGLSVYRSYQQMLTKNYMTGQSPSRDSPSRAERYVAWSVCLSEWQARLSR